MWYFAWILGVLLACALGIINVLWLEAQESLEQESVVLDPLTKTLIRFEFLSLLDVRIKQQKITHQPFSLLMIGLDPITSNAIKNRKPYTNEILIKSANILRDELRHRSDILARYDAATFSVVLSNTYAKDAEFVCQRICRNSNLQLNSTSHSSEISIGIVECDPHLLSLTGDDASLAANSLLVRADNAMKQAGLQGENSFLSAAKDDS